jgi:hypothetical protein
MRRLIVLTGLAIVGLVFFGFTLGWQVAQILGLFVGFIVLLFACIDLAGRLLGRWSCTRTGATNGRSRTSRSGTPRALPIVRVPRE